MTMMKTIDLRQNIDQVAMHHYHGAPLEPAWSTLVQVTRDGVRGGWHISLADGCRLYGANPTTEFVVRT